MSNFELHWFTFTGKQCITDLHKKVIEAFNNGEGWYFTISAPVLVEMCVYDLAIGLLIKIESETEFGQLRKNQGRIKYGCNFVHFTFPHMHTWSCVARFEEIARFAPY